jgi:hypothetical protein
MQQLAQHRYYTQPTELGVQTPVLHPGTRARGPSSAFFLGAFVVRTPHNREVIIAFGWCDQPALLQRLERVSIRRCRTYHFVVLHSTQQQIAAERIGFELVTISMCDSKSCSTSVRFSAMFITRLFVGMGSRTPLMQSECAERYFCKAGFDARFAFPKDAKKAASTAVC